MKKVPHYLKITISIISKTIIAALIGLGSSFGKNPAITEKKDNKTIASNK